MHAFIARFKISLCKLRRSQTQKQWSSPATSDPIILTGNYDGHTRGLFSQRESFHVSMYYIKLLKYPYHNQKIK